MIRVLSSSNLLFLLKVAAIILILPSLGANFVPKWVTSQFVQANSNRIINADLCNCLTNNNTSPTATILFQFPFSSVPHLGYGISGYQGNDGLSIQHFEINKTSLTPVSLTLVVQIYGITAFWNLQVRYMLISQQFPHHLNSFDNIPANYSLGRLVNISQPINYTNIKIFRNSINYTQQATIAGSKYRYFSQPLQNNKIILFMTAVNISGAYDSGIPVPLNLTVQSFASSITNYTIVIKCLIGSQIRKIHFSIIIFDQNQVHQSGRYAFTSDQITFTTSEGFYPLPIQFISNFMIGFLSYSSDKTLKVINFLTEFRNTNGTFGLYKHISNRIYIYDPILTYTFNLFYLKTWECPKNTYLDQSSNICFEYLTQLQYVSCNKLKIILSVSEGQVNQQMAENTTILNQTISVLEKLINNRTIEIICQYYDDVIKKPISVKIFNTIIIVNHEFHIPLLRYSQSECTTAENINKFYRAIEIISYVILIISCFCWKLVGLELFGVLQLSYFMLSMQNYTILYLSPISKLRIFNGLNIQLFQENSNLPFSLASLEIKAIFLNNFNIMGFVQFFCLLTGACLYKASKIFQFDSLNKLSLRILKQGFITFVMFNTFNITHSAGIHLKHSSLGQEGYIISTAFLVICIISLIASLFVMQISDPFHYGEFKDKFKDSFVCRIYVVLSICYRSALGFYSAVKYDYQYGTLIIISFSIAFILYFICNFPFSSTLHNYRASLIHISMISILIISNYYRVMLSNKPLQRKGREFTAAIIQLIAISLCLTVSIFILMYEVFRSIKNWRDTARVLDQSQQKSRVTQQQLAAY